ncbi:MAG: hypothetical protein FWB87_13715 [Defluviitaleaceae bacterium]|nr:hypothetical protein [Defluviitaleaceae bacterium]
MANKIDITKYLGNTKIMKIASDMCEVNKDIGNIREALQTLEMMQMSEPTLTEVKAKLTEYQKVSASYEVMLEGVYGLSYWECVALNNYLRDR